MAAFRKLCEAVKGIQVSLEERTSACDSRVQRLEAAVQPVAASRADERISGLEAWLADVEDKVLAQAAGTSVR